MTEIKEIKEIKKLMLEFLHNGTLNYSRKHFFLRINYELDLIEEKLI